MRKETAEHKKKVRQAWRDAHPTYGRDWYAKNRDSHLGKRLLRRYGLSLEQVERMKQNQKGRCLLCGEKKKLFVDHCYKIGKVRGLLCSTCNSVLGWVEKYPLLIEKMKQYAEAHRAIYS